ncbi:histamine H2 receptor-like [Gigantopelta aegis]|uniref:histamine H2 receptor-like n=1 Tax=Gigantopelta aegis TaxID=1735272 RepID=UPI001B8876EB|nr:histamine H2 receptor-like [Gigantopelta aegis]
MLNDDQLCENNPKRHPDFVDIIKTIIVTTMCFLVIGGNILCLIVLSSRRTRGFILDTTRILMTSLACTDCGMGLLVLPLCVYPALFHCWPFGDPICRMQALFISSLFHESTLSLVLIAVDRYISIFHPLRYPVIVTRNNVIITVVLTWFICFIVYGTVVLGFGQYYYDDVGINCEPYYQNTTVTATVMCLFYFPSAIIIVVCYLQIFRVAIEQRARISSESGFQVIRLSDLQPLGRQYTKHIVMSNSTNPKYVL